MKRKINKFEKQGEWNTYVGKMIVKHSGKPFKSGEKEGTVISLTINPHTEKDAFLMNDGSIVDCYQCKLAKSISPAEQEVLDIAKRVLENHPEGEKFFDALDEELQRTASDTIMQELFSRVPVGYMVVVSGSFGEKVANGIDEGKYPAFSYMLYRGGIRKGAEPVVLRTRTAPFDISLKAIFLDDSIYGGATYRAIQKHLNATVPSYLEECLVIYDGCPVIREDISSIFRYYDHFEAKPNYEF